MSSPYFDITDPGNAGSLRITYGRQGLTREIICDARSCRLYLGEVDTVVVEAWRWTDVDEPNIQIPTVNIGADICIAGGGDYDEATVTYLMEFYEEDTINLTLPVPRHARWYTPIIQWDEETWGSELVDINFFGYGVAPFIFSASNYLWLPSSPRLEVVQSPLSISSAGQIDRTLRVGARFWIST